MFSTLVVPFLVMLNFEPSKTEFDIVELDYLGIFASVIISSSSLFFNTVFMGNLYIVFQNWPRNFSNILFQKARKDIITATFKIFVFFWKQLAFWKWPLFLLELFFQKRSLTDSKWVTRVPESRILFLVHSSSSAFLEFQYKPYYMTRSCDRVEAISRR